jgi:hypothetical protein
MSTHQPERPQDVKLDWRPGDAPVPDLQSPPLTPEAEAKIKAGLSGTGSTEGDLKGFTEN